MSMRTTSWSAPASTTAATRCPTLSARAQRRPPHNSSRTGTRTSCSTSTRATCPGRRGSVSSSTASSWRRAGRARRARRGNAASRSPWPGSTSMSLSTTVACAWDRLTCRAGRATPLWRRYEFFCLGEGELVSPNFFNADFHKTARSFFCHVCILYGML